MAINAYAKDSLVRVNVEFTLNSLDTDPSTVKCFYKNASGTVTTLTYGTDAAVVRDATGKYHVDIFVSTPGTWFYRFEGSGTITAASEGEFYVNPSQII